MELCYYYQILDSGILYEKGRQTGNLWRLGERKRLRDEVFVWKRILEYIELEDTGIDCAERLFENMDKMCQKYHLPHYERVLRMKDELLSDSCRFETDKEEQIKINQIISGLLTEMEKHLSCFKGKARVYKILAVLHNFPKVMHGSNALNKNCHVVTYEDALAYAQGYMDDTMKERIGRIC